MLIAKALLLLQAATGSVHGTVRAHPSGEPVPHATVTVPELNRRAVADARGYYVLAGLPAGPHRVLAAAPGHATDSATVTVPEDVSVRLDLSLAVRAVRLEGVSVTAAPPLPGRDAAGPAATRLDAQTIKSVPAVGEADAFRAIQTLPSVAAASDYSTALYLRGGTPDQTMVTVDGVTLFNPYHLGGLFSAIDPDAIATVDVQPGALPARGGDRLSGAVALHTKDGGRDRWRSTGGVSLISSRIGLDGPIGASTMLLSVRRTYMDLASRAASGVGLIEGHFPYAFTDAHLKISGPSRGAGQWSISGYLNDEGFNTPDDWTEDLDDEDLNWQWGTAALAGRYRRTLGGDWLLDARVAGSRFAGELTVGRGESQERPLYSSMSNLTAAVEMTRYSAAHRLSAGVELNGYRFAHDVFRGSEGDLARLLPHIDRVDRTTTAAFHVSDEWHPSERLSGRLGVRVLSVLDGATLVLPRFGARFGLTPELALTAGAGRYAQTLRSLKDEESLYSSIFAFDLLVAAPAGRPSTSEDATLGVEWAASPATTLRADLFARRLHGLTVPLPQGDPLDTPLLVASDSATGSGSAHGLEVHATHRAGRRAYSLAYTFSRAEREVEDEVFMPRFHRPHTLDASVLTPLGRSGQLSARFQWASGQPFTPAVSQTPRLEWDATTGTWIPTGMITVYGEHNSGRLPAYRRLDLALKRSYQRRWFGKQTTITPYFQVINALGNRNVLFATPEWGESGPQLEYGPQMPTIPSFGIEWSF